MVKVEKIYSHAKISIEDLQRLGEIARSDREMYFQKYPPVLTMIAVVLCQGAAQHYVDGKHGINDFDVLTFYVQHPGFPNHPVPRRVQPYDFGDPKFGKSGNRPAYIGKRVDLLGRSLKVDVGADPVKTIQQYLHEQKTESARLWAQKPVILIEPAELLGMIVWKPA